MSEQQSSCASASEKSGTVEYRELADFPGYRFGSDGSVWTSIEAGRWHRPLGSWKQRAQQLSRGGYWTISMPVRLPDGRMGQRTYLTHHLTLWAFVGPKPEGMEGCHNNGVKADNRTGNLRWDTHQSNNDDKRVHGTVLVGEAHQNSVLTESQVSDIRRMHDAGSGYKALGAKFRLSPSHVRDIVKRKIWKHIE